MSQFHLQASRAKLAASLAMAVGTLVLTGSARAQFVTYDSFDTFDSAKWNIVASSTAPDVSSGVASFDGSDAIRSTQTFPLGSTVRVNYSSVNTPGPVIIGVNSQPDPNSFASNDALFVRNDGGLPMYVSTAGENGTGSGAYSTPPNLADTNPGTFEFALGETLSITQNSTTLFSTARPALFDAPQQIELIVYGGGTFVIDEVSVAAVPEPTALVALGLPAAGLLLRRRRR